MQSRIEDMVAKLQTLNIKNVELFSSSMDKYREKFVEASANAIAEVQVDNVNAITDANAFFSVVYPLSLSFKS